MSITRSLHAFFRKHQRVLIGNDPDALIGKDPDALIGRGHLADQPEADTTPHKTDENRATQPEPPGDPRA